MEDRILDGKSVTVRSPAILGLKKQRVSGYNGEIFRIMVTDNAHKISAVKPL